MSKPSGKLWVVFAALAMMLAFSSLQAQPPAGAGPGIKLGTDCWHTEPGTEATLFLPPDACSGFRPAHMTVKLKGLPLSPEVVKTKCGCQVDTKIEYIDPHGNVTTERTVHTVRQRTTETTDVDTCVRRSQDVKFHGKGVAQKVEIRLVELSLESEKPVTITYKDGHTHAFKICISESSGEQRPGSMTFTPSTLGRLSRGNVNLQQLHIRYDMTFIEPAQSCAAPPRGACTIRDNRLVLKNGRRPGTFEQLVASP